VFQGKPETFTPPVAANGHIYCRSYLGEVVCLRTGKN
jgi:outer membrane protein assembly factor BamB